MVRDYRMGGLDHKSPRYDISPTMSRISRKVVVPYCHARVFISNGQYGGQTLYSYYEKGGSQEYLMSWTRNTNKNIYKYFCLNKG